MISKIPNIGSYFQISSEVFNQMCQGKTQCNDNLIVYNIATILQLIILSMIKTMDSFDGQLELESFLSPDKNKSPVTIQTAPSLEYSDFIRPETQFKFQSTSKSFNFEHLPIQTPRQFAISEDRIPGKSTGSKLSELQLLQRLFSEAYADFKDRQIQIKVNNEKIERFQHTNKLQKNEVIHLKKMTEYLREKQAKCKKRLRMKTIQEQREIKNQIAASKERSMSYYQEIKQLKYQISEQKKFKKQLIRNKSLRNLQKNKKQSSANPFNFMPFGMPQNPYSAPSVNSYGNLNTSSKQSDLQTKKSFDHSTPQFISHKTSFENMMPQPSSQPFNTNILIHALNSHLNEIAKQSLTRQNSNPNCQQVKREVKLIKSSGKISGKWENTEQERDFLNIMEGKIKQNPHFLRADTPHFPIHKTESQQFNFTHLHQKISAEQSLNSTQKVADNLGHEGRNSAPKRKSAPRNSYLNPEQSNINIYVEQSVSSMSKFSAEKRRNQNIKQSTVQIDMQQESSKSNEISIVDDNYNIRDKSPTVPNKASANSSFEKIAIQQGPSSQIILKRLAPPPNLLANKKLRKVTEQQSDLFDSNGDPRVDRAKHKKQKSDNVSIKDVIIDQQNLKQSEAFSRGNQINESIPSIQEQTIVKIEERAEEHKPTEQESDDEEFLQINLNAVSKISRQKQFSQRQVKQEDEQDIEDSLKQSQKVYKSQNLKPIENKRTSQPIRNKETDKEETDKLKMQSDFKRVLRSSGGRFSGIIEPTQQPIQI